MTSGTFFVNFKHTSHFILQLILLKCTLMQIWKSPYMFVFIQKEYPENFTFLILRIINLFAREVYKSVKK